MYFGLSVCIWGGSSVHTWGAWSGPHGRLVRRFFFLSRYFYHVERRVRRLGRKKGSWVEAWRLVGWLVVGSEGRGP